MSAQPEEFPERTVEVEASTAPPPREVCCYDFTFAFRDPCFSDRELILEVLNETSEGSEVAIEKVPVSTAVLASRSPVFRKMFSNGMLESEKDQPVTVKLGSQEKLAFLAMLHFIYTGSFSDVGPDSAKSWEELLQLLLVADVYQVLSVISAVASILRKLSENIELLQKSAFELPEHLHQYAEIKSAIIEAHTLLFQRYKKVSTWNDSAFASLSIEAISFLLQNDELQCSSEEEVFQQVQRWMREKFETAESRERVMSELCPHLRFAHMSGEFLQERVIYDPDMQSFVSQKHIVEGLLYTASSETKKGLNQEKRFFERIGVEKPWTFEFTCKARVDAAGAETLSPSYESRGTKWCIRVKKDIRKTPNTVGLYLVQSPLTNEELTRRCKHVRFDFSVKSQNTGEWTIRRSDGDVFTSSRGKGHVNFFGKAWDLVSVDRTWVDQAGDMELRVKARIRMVS